MTIRAANATIKGYYYQFATSILKLLDLQSSTDTITVEGIEDIDINTATDTTAVQCKYLSKPRFINSAVREPIILMLDHFVNPSTPSNYNYVLYAHFETEVPGNEPTIDLAKLKEILTYSEKKVEKHYEIENSISDVQLNDFLLQFKFIFGEEFNAQQQRIINKLKSQFSCTDFEADTFFYNNALRVVIDKAIQKDIAQRVITKAEFLSVIDCSKKLFSEWFIKLRSKKDYLKLLAQNLKSTRTLEPSRTKIILIGKNILDADNSELPLLSFIDNLVSKYYKLGSALRDAKPLTIVLGCHKSERLAIKSSLIDSQIHFNDGYEEIKFSPDTFNREPIINKTTNGSKILKSSYSLKLISKDTFEANISNINSPHALIVFSQTDFLQRFATGQFIDIKYCDNLKEVHKLLIP